jgi:glycosyltransferase involved in cell wall biosynthesis
VARALRTLKEAARQDQNLMPAVLDALDIMVSTAEAEACSRAVLEAMASGTPVVAADTGGNPELIADGETGLLFPAGDGQALVAALLRLIQEPDLRQRMGQAARARTISTLRHRPHYSGLQSIWQSGPERVHLDTA